MILNELTGTLKNHYDTVLRDGIHVSDLTLCMRKMVFRKLKPVPTTMKELNFFTSGRAIHDAIQTLAQYNPKYQIEKEVEHRFIRNIEEGSKVDPNLRVTGHIDLYDSENNIPVECKSSRANQQKGIKSFHLKQLEIYMAMVNSEKGLMLYQNLMHFGDTPFQEYEVEGTKDKNQTTLKWVEEKAELYANALEQEDPELADDVMNNSDMNWLCKDCVYKKECTEMSHK